MSHAVPAPANPLPRTSASTGRYLAAIAAITLLATGVRAYRLGSRDFWFDESCTHVHVRNLFLPDASPLPLSERPLAAYYAVAWAWTRAFGDSEVAYRSLSLVASVLLVPVLGYAARRLAGPAAGRIAALLAAFNPLSVYYAREARPYALWMLLLSGTLALLIVAVQRNRRRDWCGFGFALLLTLHFHAFTIWWAPWSVALVAFAGDRRAAVRRWLLTLLVVGVAYLPMLVSAVVPVARLGSNAWIADAPQDHWPILRSLSAWLPAGEYPQHLHGLSLLSSDTIAVVPETVSVGISFTTIALIALLAGSSLLRRQGPWQAGPSPRPRVDRSRDAPSSSAATSAGTSPAAGDPNRGANPNPGCAPETMHPSRATLALALLSLGPLLMMQAYASWVRPCYVVGRYDLVGWPTFILGLAVCASTTRLPRGAIAALVVLLGLCSVDPLLRMGQTPPGSSFAKARASRVSQLASPTDLVVTLSYDRAYLAYYLDRTGFQARIRSFPRSLDEHIGWVDTVADLTPEALSTLTADAGGLIEAADAVHLRGGSVWFLPDSLDPQNRGARAPIHRVLGMSLAAARYRIVPADEPLLIGRLER